MRSQDKTMVLSPKRWGTGSACGHFGLSQPGCRQCYVVQWVDTSDERPAAHGPSPRDGNAPGRNVTSARLRLSGAKVWGAVEGQAWEAELSLPEISGRGRGTGESS